MSLAPRLSKARAGMRVRGSAPSQNDCLCFSSAAFFAALLLLFEKRAKPVARDSVPPSLHSIHRADGHISSTQFASSITPNNYHGFLLTLRLFLVLLSLVFNQRWAGFWLRDWLGGGRQVPCFPASCQPRLTLLRRAFAFSLERVAVSTQVVTPPISGGCAVST